MLKPVKEIHRESHNEPDPETEPVGYPEFRHEVGAAGKTQDWNKRKRVPVTEPGEPGHRNDEPQVWDAMLHLTPICPREKGPNAFRICDKKNGDYKKINRGCPVAGADIGDLEYVGPTALETVFFHDTGTDDAKGKQGTNTREIGYFSQVHEKAGDSHEDAGHDG